MAESPLTLEQLSADWLKAKKAEAAANKERVAIEDQIVALTGKRDEGSQTVDATGFKITVTGKVSMKLDWDAWAKVRDQIPRNLWPIKTEEKLDERGVKYLRNNEPEIYSLIPVEIKPAKTAVEVKAVDA
jgi:hypothetical protein